MAGKTLIGGTNYRIVRGKTLIEGTAYTINKGKTLIGGTGYKILLATLQYARLNEVGTSWPTGSYTATFTETESSLKAQLLGSAPTSQDWADRYKIGYAIYTEPGATVMVTVNANAGGLNSENHIAGTTAISQNTAWNNYAATVTAPSNGIVTVRATNGNTNISDRWIEITKVVINGTQVFPV